MRSVGVRQLKADASRILRSVRERGEQVEITHRGETIAYLVPAQPAQKRRGSRRLSHELDRLAREIQRHWPKGVNAVDALRDIRR